MIDIAGFGEYNFQLINECYSYSQFSIFTEYLRDANGYEQLCINFINEKLQNLFCELMITQEEQWYEKENLDIQKVPFFDNGVILGSSLNVANECIHF